MIRDNWLVIIGCNYQDSGTSLPWRRVQLLRLLAIQYQMGSARQKENMSTNTKTSRNTNTNTDTNTVSTVDVVGSASVRERERDG